MAVTRLKMLKKYILLTKEKIFNYYFIIFFCSADKIKQWPKKQTNITEKMLHKTKGTIIIIIIVSSSNNKNEINRIIKPETKFANSSNVCMN